MSSRAQRRTRKEGGLSRPSDHPSTTQPASGLSTFRSPNTPEGKLAQAHRAFGARGARSVSSRNFRHGLAGRLIIATLSAEDAAEFESLASGLRLDHEPSSITENLLVDRMAESYYLSSRAIGLQAAALASGDDSRLSLLLRYQTTHERTFSKCLSDLTKLRKARRLEQIGFESQKQKQEADEAERKADEKRKALRKMEREFHAYVNAPMPRYDWPLPGDPEGAENEEDDEQYLKRLMAKHKAKPEVELEANAKKDAARGFAKKSDRSAQAIALTARSSGRNKWSVQIRRFSSRISG